MPVIEVGGRRFTARAIVLDKDGTSVDIHHLWGTRTMKWVNEMVQRRGDGTMRPAFCQRLRRRPPGESAGARRPLGGGDIATVGTLAAGVVYQNGWPWHEAEELARTTALRDNSGTAGEWRTETNG